MKRPNVIDPPDYQPPKGEYDPGVCSCPKCNGFYEYAGRVIRSDCGFAFPTDWWSMYSKGCSDGLRVANGAAVSGGMKRRCDHHPYYRYGFEHPVKEAWEEKENIDWTVTVGSIESLPLMRDYSYCDRCGKDKADGRQNRSGECQQCEAETYCKHLAREDKGGIGLDYVCRAGVDIKALVGDEPGWFGRLPCQWWEGGCPVACGKFEPIGIDSVKADDEAMAISMAKTFAAMSVVPAIKKKHKGKSWSGVVECPVCKGKLHVSHAAYNGHVHGHCETDGCVSWME